MFFYAGLKGGQGLVRLARGEGYHERLQFHVIPRLWYASAGIDWREAIAEWFRDVAMLPAVAGFEKRGPPTNDATS